MNDSEVEALATAVKNHLLTSPDGRRGTQLILDKPGETQPMAVLSEATIQQRAAQAIRHHNETEHNAHLGATRE